MCGSGADEMMGVVTESVIKTMIKENAECLGCLAILGLISCLGA